MSTTSSDSAGSLSELSVPTTASAPPVRYSTPAVRAAGDTSLNSQWSSFLAEAEVDTTVTITKASGDNEPDTFAATSNRFWGLVFNSSENPTRFDFTGAELDSAGGGPVLIALDVDIGATPSVFQDGKTAITLGDVLTKFGVVSDDTTGAIITAIGDTLNVDVDTSEKRNGFWCLPGSMFKVATNLSFKISDTSTCSLSTIGKALGDAFGFSMSTIASNPTFYLQHTVMGIPIPPTDSDSDADSDSGSVSSSSSFSISSAVTLTVQLVAKGFIFLLECSESGLQCTLAENPDSKDDLWTRLSALNGGDSVPTQDTAKPDLDSGTFPQCNVWNISLFKDAGQTSLRWQLRFILEWQSSSDDTSVPLLLSYDSADSTFAGSLLFSGSFPDPATYQLLPWYDPLTMPPASVSLSDGFDLTKLFSPAQSISSSIPTTLTSAMVSYTKDTGLISLSATLARDDSTGSFTPAPLSPFTWDSISLSVEKDSAVSFDIFASFTLRPYQSSDSASSDEVASLHTQLSYANSIWGLSAGGASIPFRLLWSYFDQDVRDPILSVLGDLKARSLDLYYTYNSKAEASSFLFTGRVALGGLELRLFYQYTTKEAASDSAAHKKLKSDNGDPSPITVASGLDHDWAFECDLASPNPFRDYAPVSIADIADCFVDGGSSNLPDFVGLMAIEALSEVTAASLRIAKTGASGSGQITFVLSITAGPFNVTLAQLSAPKQQTGQSTSSGGADTKRVLRVTAKALPTMTNIPLVNELPPLFGELIYMWVTPSPLTVQDIATINAQLGEADPILCRATTASQTANAVAFKPGHHFLLAQDGAIILDHFFDHKSKTADSGDGSTDAGDSSDPPAAPTNGSLVKKSGIVSISGIGLQYKEGSLWLSVDGTLSIGPIAVTLLGFGVGIPLAGVRLDNLEAVVGSLQWHLDGLGVLLSKPPLLMAGVFEHVTISDQDSYRGGIALAIPPYTFLAVGEYSTVTLAGRDYKSVFVFAKLDGRE